MTVKVLFVVFTDNQVLGMCSTKTLRKRHKALYLNIIIYFFAFSLLSLDDLAQYTSTKGNSDFGFINSA